MIPVKERPVFFVRYRSWAALQRDCKNQIKMQGLFLKIRAKLAQFTPVSIQLSTPNGDAFDLDGEVLQLVAGQGMAVQFTSVSTTEIKRLVENSNKEVPNDQEAAIEDDPWFGEPGDQPPGPASKTPEWFDDTQNLKLQIEQMNVNQKRYAALHGRKDMRMLLIRDQNKTIHPFVIKNPAITLDEIEQIAKLPSVNPDVLRALATSKDWTRSTSICRNLVRNPKTPLKEALALLSRLPMSEIRALAKSGHVRTAIQQAARKIVAG